MTKNILYITTKSIIILYFLSFLSPANALTQYKKVFDTRWFIEKKHLPENTYMATPPYIMIIKNQSGYNISGFDGCNYISGSLQKIKSLFYIANAGETSMQCANLEIESFATYMRGILQTGNIHFKESNIDGSIREIIISDKTNELHFINENSYSIKSGMR